MGEPTAAGVPEEDMQRIAAAVDQVPDLPSPQPRKLLIFTLCKGFVHSSIPHGAAVLSLLGKKTGAYEATVSDDPAVFTREGLAGYDAVCFLNTTGELFDSAESKQALLEFVASGKGFVGIHAATDCFYKWPEYGEMIGAYFDGHPWGAGSTVTIKVEEPKHPLCAAFAGGRPTRRSAATELPTAQDTFEITDEIYQFRNAPYSRQKLRVLVSLDTTKTDMTVKGIKRQDGDFAVSWIRPYEKGRVFHCSLGHREDIYWNPAVLKHYLAGIRYAMGDLSADDKPVAADLGTLDAGRQGRVGRGGPPEHGHASVDHATRAEAGDGWIPLFNGRDLDGWRGTYGDPKSRAGMSDEERAQAQAQADERMRQHWRVVNGLLTTDGQGDNLATARDYTNFELMLDYRIEAGGDSGIYLRGTPQVQIWDPAQNPVGSGGLYNNKNHAKDPLTPADEPVGQWNRLFIRMVGERVTVHLNNVLVVDNVVMENYWEPDRPIYPTGPIELQKHDSPLWFRNIFIRELPGVTEPVLGSEAARTGTADTAVAHTREHGHASVDHATQATQGPAGAGHATQGDGWEPLFNGQDLTGWVCNPGSWEAEGGVLTRKGGGDIWTEQRFGDFVLDLEFKLDKETNSGVFIRTGSIKEWLHTAIEVQVLDSHGKDKPDLHDCGAIYDCLAPSKNAVKPAGEWNRYVITCRGPKIEVVLNGQPIIDMDLDRWTEAHKNPDGTPNKFNTAYKDMPREGHIGLQDHGKPIWYRNIRIKRLDTAKAP